MNLSSPTPPITRHMQTAWTELNESNLMEINGLRDDVTKGAALQLGKRRQLGQARQSATTGNSDDPIKTEPKQTDNLHLRF